MLQQLRRCLRVLCLCVLVSVLILIVRQTSVTKMAPVSLVVGYFTGRFRSNFTGYDEDPSDQLRFAAHRNFQSRSETWRLGYGPTNGSACRVSFPRLYSALRQLKAGPVSVNITSQLVGAAKACQRPQSINLIAELNRTAMPEALPNEGGALASAIWAPRDCWPPLSRTAVIVPYRNRSENLDVFVPYMYNLLSKQNILFGLFVIEQANTKLFNRAKLLNVGFRVAQQFYPFDCFVFQDADKVPENAANIFDCINSPKLMISEMRSQKDPKNKYNPGRLYSNFFGGTVAISREVFQKVNGNSNRYYGWGREDDELAARLGIRGYQLRYNSGPDCRFVNLKHGDDIVSNSMPWPYQHMVRETISTDGLSSLNYTDMGVYAHPMFILVRADL